MEKGIQTFNKVITAVMHIPSVKVDRDAFLRQQLSPYCAEETLARAIESPVGVISEKTLNRIADAVINEHTCKVTTLSAIAGMPGGLALLGTVPGDMAQYYWHIMVLAQKLAYIYGIPDMLDEDGNLSEKAMNMLTLFIGVMMGAEAANQVIKRLCSEFAMQATRHLTEQALTKSVWYPIVRQTAKWIGIKMTRQLLGRTAGKVVPIVGGLISGALTYASFHPSAKRLQKKLRQQMREMPYTKYTTSSADTVTDDL